MEPSCGTDLANGEALRLAGTVKKSDSTSFCHSTRYTMQVSLRPRISIAPRLRKRTRLSGGSWLMTTSVPRIWSGPERSDRRDATLTASPKKSPSCSMTSPRAMPTCRRILSFSGQVLMRSACTRCISVTASMASVFLINTISTPSPRFFTTWPFCVVQTLPIHCVSRVMACVALELPSDSKTPVLPVRSAKTTVTSAMYLPGLRVLASCH